VIRIDCLRKTYGAVVAVDDLSLEVAPGTVLGFLGRNGAGKTTTIRMMVGLLEPTAGTVVLAGHDIRRAPEAAKAVTGYLPDQPHLYDKLTGHEYLTFVAGLYGVPRGETRPRAASLLDELGLAPHADALVETFSHGMRQRLALAGALIHRPRILVLDEPMVGLDPEGALELRRLLRRLAREGVAIFLSTHSLAVAEDVSTQIAILDGGRLVAFGTLEELRARALAAGGNGQAPAEAASLEDVFLGILGSQV
jgi:ABC-2 type transport system ATP-binding protein